MTEREWLTCGANTEKMQRCLRGRASPRKLGLIACACCRHIESLLDGDPGRAIEAVERCADGDFDPALLEDLRQQAARMRFQPPRPRPEVLALAAVYWTIGCSLSEDDLDHRVSTAAYSAQRASGSSAEAEWQARILCDILGGSISMPAVDAAWVTSDVTALAKGMYESRDFSPMPILADALQDAGCENADILSHCRDEKQPHARGCWVIDLLLGKS
jgi:hypothetical protein